MGLAELQITLTFEVTYCCIAECGVPIVMPTQVYNRFRNDHDQWFHCCFGHRQHFTGKTEAEKLQQQLDSEKRSNEWNKRRAERAERTTRAFKGQVTLIRNRVKNGVCPCCNRTFQNLMRHMATKHPEYAKTESHEKDPA